MPGYLLDTNVISEVQRRQMHPGVHAFLAAADSTDLYLSVLTLGELRKGVEMRARTDTEGAVRLSAWVDGLAPQFANRILPIDAGIAELWGKLSVIRTLPVIDTLIAATALVHGLIVVTRNTEDFEPAGVTLLNPWT